MGLRVGGSMADAHQGIMTLLIPVYEKKTRSPEGSGKARGGGGESPKEVQLQK